MTTNRPHAVGRPLTDTVIFYHAGKAAGLPDHAIADRLGIAHLSLRRMLLRARTRGLL